MQNWVDVGKAIMNSPGTVLIFEVSPPERRVGVPYECVPQFSIYHLAFSIFRYRATHPGAPDKELAP